MNISKPEQKVLHVLARGGRIILERDHDRKIIKVICVTREGWRLTGFSILLFKKLKRRHYICSQNSRPYQITPRGLSVVRGQVNNQ
ncbi:YjhX family toxin [Parvibaculum lavamentivorans]|nr:YjhX family toxin [Parvibaculum lavamentivorans]